jgi:S1-C subfamily serine protease
MRLAHPYLQGQEPFSGQAAYVYPAQRTCRRQHIGRNTPERTDYLPALQVKGMASVGHSSFPHPSARKEEEASIMVRPPMLGCFVLLVVLLLAFSTSSQSGEEKPHPMTVAQTIEIIRPATVQITLQVYNVAEESRELIRQKHPAAMQTGSAYHIPQGTGFLVNADGYVVTAYHVIRDGRQLLAEIKADRKRLVVAFAEPNIVLPNGREIRANFQVSSFTDVSQNPNADLSLLKVNQIPMAAFVKEMPFSPLKPPVLRTKRPQDGEPIAVSGYPFGEPVLVTNAGWLGSAWAFQNINNIPMDVYLGDVVVNPGNSGGPVYSTETGAVLGVCVVRTSAPRFGAGLISITPTRYIVELLNQNHVNWSAYKE